jgi:hypothetical protein
LLPASRTARWLKGTGYIFLLVHLVLERLEFFGANLRRFSHSRKRARRCGRAMTQRTSKAREGGVQVYAIQGFLED